MVYSIVRLNSHHGYIHHFLWSRSKTTAALRSQEFKKKKNGTTQQPMISAATDAIAGIESGSDDRNLIQRWAALPFICKHRMPSRQPEQAFAKQTTPSRGSGSTRIELIV